jgi:glycogen debranching enzyme
MRQTYLLLLLGLFAYGIGLEAQSAPPTPPVLPALSENNSSTGLTIAQQASADKPFSVIGPAGALLGDRSGKYEVWIFPWKIFSGMRMTANMDGYPVPIDVNDHAAEIDVKPDHTTLMYSHANFTVRQTMMAPKQSADGTGVLIFYQIQAVRPMTLTFSFEPNMQRMWPAPSDGSVEPEWVKNSSGDSGGSGFYILHQNFPDHAAALAMPSAQPGILQPYQERAHTWPLQFVLRFDPAKDSATTFPLLITFANTKQAATKAALAESLLALDQGAMASVQANANYYREFTAQHASIETPDEHLNQAFSWAEVSVDQLRVESKPDRTEEAFAGGFVGSGDSARPGFGWFFGRDALWSLYAINSYGDLPGARGELEFLMHHQRADGKIMHEWSQTADLVEWKSVAYEFASADSTPLLQMVVNDYFKISGDEAFLRSHWKELMLAWTYETTHDSSDGIYNNSSGTGWVESWIPQPQQELYLAAVDEQASLAFANLAKTLGHTSEAEQATQRAARLRDVIEKEYYLPQTGFYAFSRNADGTTDNTATTYPSVAWWDGDYALEHTDKVLSRWASSEFSTDWGARSVGDQESVYDPISYHQGTVWPLFTGWLAVAEYRNNQPLAGYQSLMQNANLTWSQDLGSVTELLSGAFYQGLGRSDAHQLWSSAMVISPVLRGMFGLQWDVPHHTLGITPHLPADWAGATVHRLPFGKSTLDLTFARRGQELIVNVMGPASSDVLLHSESAGAKVEGHELHIPLPTVEAAFSEQLPKFGSATQQMKILHETISEQGLELTLSAPSSSHQTISLRENRAGLHLHSAEAQLGSSTNGLRDAEVVFPAGNGYVTKVVRISW